MGEALTQAQRVAADRDALTALLAGGIDRPGLDLAALGRMFTRITERHAERMAELGLDGLTRQHGQDAACGRRPRQHRRRPSTSTAATTTCQPWRHQSTPNVLRVEEQRVEVVPSKQPPMPQRIVSHSGHVVAVAGGDQLAEQADHGRRRSRPTVRADDHASRIMTRLTGSVTQRQRKPTWPAVPWPIST